MVVDEMPIASFQEQHTPAPRAPRSATSATSAASSLPPAASGARLFNIRVALSGDHHADSGALVRRMYAWRGYTFENSAAGAPDKLTLYAETGGELVGTMSLCLDQGASLPADENFRDRLDILRRQGRRLAEPSRLAIDAGMSKRVFASLIHISFLYAHRLHGYTDYVIEVNPRHVAFYRHMLGFAEFGAERQCSRVGAPAVLLRLPLDHMGAQIARWGGTLGRHAGERSFYPYFFPVRDEPAIAARLAAACEVGAYA